MMASLGNFKTHGGNSDDRGNSGTHNFGTLNFWGSAKIGVFYLLPVQGVLHDPVAKCRTSDLEAPGLNLTGSAGVFLGRVFGQDTSESQPSNAETQETHEYLSCCCEMTEISFKTP